MLPRMIKWANLTKKESFPNNMELQFIPIP